MMKEITDTEQAPRDLLDDLNAALGTEPVPAATRLSC